VPLKNPRQQIFSSLAAPANELYHFGIALSFIIHTKKIALKVTP
jgi:hypothetical protein